MVTLAISPKKKQKYGGNLNLKFLIFDNFNFCFFLSRRRICNILKLLFIK